MSTNTYTNKENINIEQMTKDLLLQWLEKKEFLSSADKRTLFELGCACLNDVGSLYRINSVIIKKQESLSEMDSKLNIKFESEKCFLKFNDQNLELEVNQLRELIIGMIDILEKILPLGSVVDLKKEFLQNHMKLDNVENIRIVITHRYLYKDGDSAYFPYAGVVYPIGMFNKNGVIHFTPALIKDIVHTGYSDIQDGAYVYMMKRELVLEKDMHSYGFSTEEERNKFQSRMDIEGVENNDKN